MDSDGRMNEHEFSVAVHLIQMKVDKHDLPKMLPASMKINPLQSPVGVQPTPHIQIAAPVMNSATMKPAMPISKLWCDLFCSFC